MATSFFKGLSWGGLILISIFYLFLIASLGYFIAGYLSARTNFPLNEFFFFFYFLMAPIFGIISFWLSFVKIENFSKTKNVKINIILVGLTFGIFSTFAPISICVVSLLYGGMKLLYHPLFLILFYPLVLFDFIAIKRIVVIYEMHKKS